MVAGFQLWQGLRVDAPDLVKALLDRAGQQFPVLFGDVGAAQADDDAISRPALAVAIRLDELENLSGGGCFISKEHSAIIAARMGLSRKKYKYSPYIGLSKS